jgi:hypothetical protein
MELSKKHIVFTLGVSIPLDESLQFNRQLESKILYEQLLYESFLDSIKQYAQDKFNTVVNTIKDWKDAAAVIGKVLSDGDLLENFLGPLERRVIRLIKPLTTFLQKIGLDKFVNTIVNFVQKIKSLTGWKKFMTLITIGTIITYIIEKLKGTPDDIKNFIVQYFSGDFINDVVGKLTDWKSYLGWLQPIVEGVEVIYNFLKPLLQEFSKALQAFQSGDKWALKFIRENKMKYRLVKAKKVDEVVGNPTSSISAILKDLADQTGNFKTVTTRDKMIELLDGIVNIMRNSNKDFIEGSQFKEAVRAFNNKYR